MITYFCVSSCREGEGVQARRRLVDVRSAFVVPCDDIGTKCAEPPVAPSYVIETSAGNFQWGYLIDPFDVSTPEGQHEYDSLLYTLAKKGWNDPGCRGATREVRLPGSLHRSGFIAEVVEWSPDRVWSMAELVEAFGLDKLIRPRKPLAVKPGEYDRLEDVKDAVYDWLVDNHPVYGHRDAWVFIECPWKSGHTGGEQGSNTSTAYSPRDFITAGAGFRCQHASCAGRNAADLATWVLGQQNRQNTYMQKHMERFKK